MKKGFTLIELLAVIVIIAIIALIATPSILNVVDNSRKNSLKSSTFGYIDVLEKYIIESEMDDSMPTLEANRPYLVSNPNEDIAYNHFSLIEKVYAHMIPGWNTELYNDIYLNDILNIKGTLPIDGYVNIGSNKQIVYYSLIYDGYVVSLDTNTNKPKIEKTDEVSIPAYITKTKNDVDRELCVLINDKMECFKNNDYENEINHMKEVFGEEQCHENSSGYWCDRNYSYLSYDDEGISYSSSLYPAVCQLNTDGFGMCINRMAKEKISLKTIDDEKSICVRINGKIECFKNNNYESEVEHLKEVFGEENCTIEGDEDLTGYFCSDYPYSSCGAISDGSVGCIDYIKYKSCHINSDGNLEDCDINE